VLSSSTREIDVKGWYTDGAVMGILFTEFGAMHNAVDAASEAILGKQRGYAPNEDNALSSVTRGRGIKHAEWWARRYLRTN
jgi:hypothetical protein